MANAFTIGCIYNGEYHIPYTYAHSSQNRMDNICKFLQDNKKAIPDLSQDGSHVADALVKKLLFYLFFVFRFVPTFGF